jgi:hypothetical protein
MAIERQDGDKARSPYGENSRAKRAKEVVTKRGEGHRFRYVETIVDEVKWLS